jgi:hypothetical protein
VTDHLTFGLKKENKLHVVQRRETKNIPWDKSSQFGGFTGCIVARKC